MPSPHEPSTRPLQPSTPPSNPPLGQGDDDALILWMLSLTPTQRLEAAQGFADSVQALRDGRRT